MRFQKNHKINNGRTPWNKGRQGYCISDKRITLQCRICREKFKVYPYRENTALFCSKKCKGVDKRNRKAWNQGTGKFVEIICKQCKNVFVREFGKRTQILCSTRCQSLALKGIKKPWVGNFMKLRLASMTEEERKEHGNKISQAKKGVPNLKLRGENSPLWRGGRMANYDELTQIRKSSAYSMWRTKVFERDDYTCQKYGIKGNKLVAHHIDNFADFPELRFAIDNGITLSDKAHKEFHKKYGTKNNTRKQLEEFLSIGFGSFQPIQRPTEAARSPIGAGTAIK